LERRRHSGISRLASGLAVVLVTTSLTAIGLVGTAEPAGAGNGDYFRLWNVQVGFCLDSNEFGEVYGLPCSARNDHQRWQLWHGGWVRNRAHPGLCLTLLTNLDVGTAPCEHYGSGDPDQMWQQWSGGWIRNPTTNRCLAMYPIQHPNGTYQVSTQVCREPVFFVERWIQIPMSEECLRYQPMC
jgi:Ricin-type beta-trefoil lectin domain